MRRKAGLHAARAQKRPSSAPYAAASLLAFVAQLRARAALALRTRSGARAGAHTSASNMATSSSISCFVSVKQNGSPLPLRTLAVGAQEPSSFQRAICARGGDFRVSDKRACPTRCGRAGVQRRRASLRQPLPATRADAQCSGRAAQRQGGARHALEAPARGAAAERRGAAHRPAQEAGVHQHIVVVNADELLTHRATAGSHRAVSTRKQWSRDSPNAPCDQASRLAQRSERGRRGGRDGGARTDVGRGGGCGGGGTACAAGRAALLRAAQAAGRGW